MKNKKGFTLAEVLVTLAVIGVVAALTIPSLIQSSSEKQARTGIKKALSVLNQALSLSVAQESIDAGSAGNTQQVLEVFDGYISALSSNSEAITSADGMVYSFWYGGACTNNAANTDCFVEVDVNGDSGSEAKGALGNYQDLYYFAILKEQVVPANSTMTNVNDVDTARGAKVTTLDNVALDALLN